jgi:Fur family transcriptional regulator, peroxide stress response regulator
MSVEREQDLLARFREALQGAGAKLTPQRLGVLVEVAHSAEHPDAEAVYRGVKQRLPSISLDTVYRTLWLLTDLGLIATLGPHRERVRFDGNTTPHHHFICLKCGRAEDFYSPECDQLSVPESVRALGAVQSTHVEFRGLCKRCAGLD